jgi:hypothetical protein
VKKSGIAKIRDEPELAEHFAELANHVVFPVHLLYAVLSTKDEVHNNLMGELGSSQERLRKVTKREVMLGWVVKDWAQLLAADFLARTDSRMMPANPGTRQSLRVTRL